MSKLVIVESPAKAKTIGKYLGSDYVVKASMGHLRDLPKKKMSIDIEHDFQPEYVPIEGKDKIIKEIRSEIRKSDFVYLATDPDREGEAISWHIKELFKLKDKNSRRVTFNEITKQAVRSGIENPRDIDIDLVNAQQARRILDRIVGYQLSPFLWRKVKRGLSAGRVQSVATRRVVDRENEIRAFVPEEYWSIEALLQTADGGKFSARYYGDANGKAELKNEEQAMHVVNAVTGKPFTVGNIKRGLNTRNTAAYNQGALCNGAFTRGERCVKINLCNRSLGKNYCLFGAYGHFLMYPRALLTDICNLHHIGVKPCGSRSFAEGGLVHTGRAGADHNAGKLILGYCIFNDLLTCL